MFKDVALEIALPFSADSNSCPTTFSLSSNPPLDENAYQFLKSTISDSYILIETDDRTIAGTYMITVTASAGTSVSSPQPITIELELIDPCAQLDDLQISGSLLADNPIAYKIGTGE